MYCVIADYSYNAISGVYKADIGGATSTLHLYANQIFDQETIEGGRTQQAQGTLPRTVPSWGKSVFSGTDYRLRIP
jgi:hypothetical protein